MDWGRISKKQLTFVEQQLLKKDIITEEIKKKNLIKRHDYCYTKKTTREELEKKLKEKKELIIYDTTKTQEKKTSQYEVRDHINQAGTNPLRNIHPIKFLDLTSLYSPKGRGIITTCLGNRFNQEKEKHKYPSKELPLIAIRCKKINKKITIRGILINH